MHQFAAHKAMQRAAGGELSPPAAAFAARPISSMGQLRAVKLRRQHFQSAPPQVPTDRACCTAQQPPKGSPYAGSPPKSRHVSRW
jgi:hypothetical protein